MSIKLGVNVDHIATIREARKGKEPDPVAAAMIAELAGCNGITAHLREDKRHIQDRDIRLLRGTVTTKLNLEMACSPEIITIAEEIVPDQATLVPEKRQEVTTEGGLDVIGGYETVADTVRRLQAKGVAVSLFLDPDPAQIDAARKI